MNVTTNIQDPFFTSFEGTIDLELLPKQFALMGDGLPHPLCKLAAHELQLHLDKQNEWEHNFGLEEEKEGTIIGKMFGVLVVKTLANEIGYLSAFSGKLAGGNHHAKFVPPVFDALTVDSFLNNGMQELTRINLEIKKLEEVVPNHHQAQMAVLKTNRKEHSIALQKELFKHYSFLNQAGEQKNLNDLFKTAFYKNPPSGAGECAAPKLLQYAFQHHLKPIGLAEFWWGLSPKSNFWEHGAFYPCCKEKCGPILAHMLVGINDN